MKKSKGNFLGVIHPLAEKAELALPVCRHGSAQQVKLHFGKCPVAHVNDIIFKALVKVATDLVRYIFQVYTQRGSHFYKREMDGGPDLEIKIGHAAELLVIITNVLVNGFAPHLEAGHYIRFIKH